MATTTAVPTGTYSPEFFDVAQSPEIRFTASAAATSADDITLNGEITIKGVTKPITLTGTVAGGGE
jgi:polyisoprenoid-binding protein YceI